MQELDKDYIETKIDDKESKTESDHCHKSMLTMMECPFCGEIFNKNNKPMVLKCTHSICNNCLKLNLITQSKCLTCEAKIVDQDIKKYATNFLLLEIIEKTNIQEESPKDSKGGEGENKSERRSTRIRGRKGKSSVKDNEVVEEKNDEMNLEKLEEQAFICTICNVAISNKEYHLSKYPNHVFSDYKSVLEDRIKKIKEKQDAIMEEYNNFNQTFHKTHDAFIEFIINNFYSQVEILKNKLMDYDFFEVMNFVGFITKSDIDKLYSFKNKFFKDERFLKSINASSNYDELFNQFSANKIEENEYNSFFENYFEIESILTKKLNNVEEKLTILEERIGKLSKEKIIKELIEDIGVQVYDSLNLDKINSSQSFRYANFITFNKNLIIFNPISESVEKIDLKTILPEKYKALEDFSSILDIDKKLYIIGGKIGNTSNKTLIQICIDKKTAIELKPLNYERLNPTTIILNNKIFVFGGKKLNGDQLNTSESYDIVSSEWKNLPNNNLLSDAKNKVYAVNWNSSNNIYLFESLKNASLYSIKEGKWKPTKLLYSGAFDLDLTNYSLVEKDDNIYFYGGIDSKKAVSDKIYYFNNSERTINIQGTLPPCQFDNNMFSLFSYANCYLMHYNETINNEYEITVLVCHDFKSQKWNVLTKTSIQDN